MADYGTMSDADLMALVQPKTTSDFSKMSDADLMAHIQGGEKSSAVGDFFKSIPRGIMSGVTTAASALGRATQGEMGQEIDAPTPEQSMAIMEKNVTGAMHQPEGRSGKFGAAVGETLGNPVSYVGPGSLPLKVGTAITSALGSEGGRQAAEGTKYEGPASLAGGVIGGGFIPAIRGGGTAIPTAAELKASGGAGYKAASGLGVEINSSGVARQAQILRADLEQQGINAELAPKTFRQLDKLESPPPGSYATVDNFRTAQRVLGNIEKDSVNPVTGKYTTESVAALQAKKHLGGYLENPPASDILAGDAGAASALIKDANGDYGAGARSDVLGSKLERAAIRASAANSGQNVANSTRQRVADILLSPKLKQGYSEGERDQMRRVVEGTTTGNGMRRVANLLGGGGGLGQLAAAGVGGGLGEYIDSHRGGAIGAVGLPSLGLLMKGGHNMSVMRQAKLLDEMIRSRSPLAEKMIQANPGNQGEMTAAVARSLLAR